MAWEQAVGECLDVDVRDGSMPLTAERRREPFIPSGYARSAVGGYIKQTDTERKVRALRDWRSESGKSIRRAAHDETIARIVALAPRTVAELLEIEGVSAMLSDVAGTEILRLLRVS